MEHISVPANPWVNYRRCLENIGDHQHVLVIQDDTLPCRNFAAALPRFAMDIPVCLFLPNLPMQTRPYARQAIQAGDHWVELRLADFVPAVATLWPAEKITEFLAWYDRRKARRRRTPVQESDDGNCGDWMRATRQSVVACLPSLVEHPDDVISLWRRNRQPRRALWFIGEDDPLAVEW